MADPHRYQEQGGKCVCGLDRFHETHFNGDRAAAGVAFQKHKQQLDEMKAWQRSLAPGHSVLIAEDHPSGDLAGCTGQVMSRTSDTCEVKTVSRQVHVKMQWLRPVPLPEPPPRFTSQEEADRWLEDTAREMGLKTDPDVPTFKTQEEADEWLERQAGEPYVPPTWTWDAVPNRGGVEWVMPDGSRRRASGAYEVRVKGIQGQQPTLIILDEAQTFDDDVIDPYADPS